MSKNQLITKLPGRDFRHYEFDLAEIGAKYNVFDILEIYPQNNKEQVK